MYPLKQNTAITLPFFAHDINGDPVTSLVDAGFTKRLDKAAAGFASLTTTITEMENGWYLFTLATGDVDTLGTLTITLVHGSIKQVNLQFRIHANLSDDIKIDTAAILLATNTNGVIVATNQDKTGYSISGIKQTLDQLNDVSVANLSTAIVNALNTAIPVNPTTDSINQRLQAIDDLTQVGGGGDLIALVNTAASIFNATSVAGVIVAQNNDKTGYYLADGSTGGGAGGVSSSGGIVVSDCDLTGTPSKRIVDLLTRVRDSLSDDDADRWTTCRLLRLIDEGQVDIARRCSLLRAKVNIPILADVNEYDLPTEALIATRAVDQYGNKVIVKSHEEMDALRADWEIRVGTQLEYVVYDKLNTKKVKIYPIPITDLGSTFVFTFTDFGMVSTVQDDLVSSDFGVIGTISTNALELTDMSSDFGLVSAMSEYSTNFIVYYLERPAEIANYSDLLTIDSIFDLALKHYVIGHALRDDKDSQNKAVGNEHIGFYNDERVKAFKDSAINYSEEPKNTQYRGGIE